MFSHPFTSLWYETNRLYIAFNHLSDPSIKEAEGPFPWAMPPGRPCSGGDPECLASGNRSLGDASSHESAPSAPIASEIPPWFQKIPPELQGNTRLVGIAKEATTMPCIAFDLPPANVSAGRVLEHCTNALERLFTKWYPMIFKIGWTHNPIWRWENDLYGYCHERDKWSNMVVLHIAPEPFSTAMLEAALIQKYQSI